MTTNTNLITLFLCGDVTTGRGIDQVLPAPSDPRIHEAFASSALAYVELAEQTHGSIPRPVSFDYVWGDNWGYRIPADQSRLAHRLIDRAGVDVVHGHSSHHAKGIEVYRDKPILYGCGDFLNDYEGISGYESFRNDLALMYIVHMAPSTGKLVCLEMTPLQMRRFQLHGASPVDAEWLRHMLNREGRKLGTRVDLNLDNTLSLRWERRQTGIAGD